MKAELSWTDRGGCTVVEQSGFSNLHFTVSFSFSNKIGRDYSNFITETEQRGKLQSQLGNDRVRV